MKKFVTVAELIEVLRHLDQDRIVVLSRDPEGNGYAPFRSMDANSTYADGEIGLEKLTPALKKQGYTDEDVLKGKKAIVLWP